MKYTTIIIFFFISMQATATNYYLSNQGSDLASGQSPASPWRSIKKLNTVIVNRNAGDSIFFKRGDTFNGQIKMESSAARGNTIYFGDYGQGSKPIITGFNSITSWRKAGVNLWEADCNSGATLNMVTINGAAAAMGRYPDKANYLTVENNSGLTKITGSGLAASTNWEGAQLVIRTTEYTWDRCRITGQNGATLTYVPSSGHEGLKGYGFFIQDDKRTLSVQNEWWYDALNHKLLLYSTSDPSKLQVKAATTDFAANFHYQHNTSFYNIQFDGFDTTAIRSFGGEHLTIANCDFNFIGADALVIDQGNRVLVRGNSINQILNTGVRMVYSKFSSVTSNQISNCGLITGMGLSNNQQMNGILAESLGDSVIIDSNIIRKVGYCGITFSGRYTQVRNNVVDSFCLTVTDGGGIYTCCNNLPGRVVSSNIITNGIGNHEATVYKTNGGAVPIYMDDHTTGVSILNNTVMNGNRYGIFLHNAHEITITGNQIYNNKGAAAIGYAQDKLGPSDPLRNNVLVGNYIHAPAGSLVLDVYSLSDDIKQVGTFESNHYLAAPGKIISYIVSGGTAPSFGASYTLDEWKKTYGFDKSSSHIKVSAGMMKMEINSGSKEKIISLDKTWSDLESNIYKGSIRLKPYQSKILIKN